LTTEHSVANISARIAHKQGRSSGPPAEALRLHTERLGPLPLLNHFLGRLGLEPLLARYVPTEDRRVALPYATALGVLLRSLLVEREPIYRQAETVRTFTPALYGLDARQSAHVGDDQIRRALDRLFDADRAALLTAVLVAVGKRFGVQFAQLHRGRPRPQRSYRKLTRRRPDLEWSLDEEAVAYDRKSDGMYPLLTNDRTLSPAQVLEAHKGQPTIEKRFEQIKTVHEIAPVLLKNEGRIEALFTLYFLTLLVQGLIEPELRRAMARRRIPELPLYPEERRCKAPTTEQVLRLFSLAERHTLLRGDRPEQVFHADLTDLQRQVLDLLGVPATAYRPWRRSAQFRGYSLREVRNVGPERTRANASRAPCDRVTCLPDASVLKRNVALTTRVTWRILERRWGTGRDGVGPAGFDQQG